MKVAKQEWYNILKTRCYPALKLCQKCTDKEIREYVNSIRMWVLFEEKVLIFLVTPRPEQGDAMEKEVEPSTKNPVAPGGAPSQAANTPELLLAGGQAAAAAVPSPTATSEQASTESAPPAPLPTPTNDIPSANKAAEPEPQSAPCEDGQNCGEGHKSAQPTPQPPLPAGTITPLIKADERAAGILAEKVVARAVLKTQPSVAEDFPDSGEEEEP